MRTESEGEFKRGASHCRVLRHAAREGIFAAIIIMLHVATKPLVAISTDARKTKAVTSVLLIRYLGITKLINNNN